jgi:uncharacterized protein YjbI with pentapeptide repeats
MNRNASTWQNLRRNHAHALAIGGGIIVAALFGLLLWWLLDLYIKPDEARAPSTA